jgi:hypothetical protein
MPAQTAGHESGHTRRERRVYLADANRRECFRRPLVRRRKAAATDRLFRVREDAPTPGLGREKHLPAISPLPASWAGRDAQRDAGEAATRQAGLAQNRK